ncbi:MAG: Glycerate dehydrogenase [Lentisphaerae bacterium ADurb.Bin242]|nr:MAG: Glycerate dehydrogenase [Lentisphaerae bacterium ADurb.Bin242]
MKTVLISGGEDAVPAPYLQEIRDAGIELECKACTTEDEVVEFSRDADLIWMFGPNRGLTPGALERLPKCKGIFRSGSGLDALPVEAAQKRGIRVYNTPESIAESVAEHAVALLFALVRQIPYYDASVKAGKWGAATHIRWHISGRTLGLVGYGRIARAVEQMVKGFRMEVIHFDPMAPDSIPLDELLARSDYVSLHCPLTPETRGLFNADKFKLMKQNALLVNTSRGAVINEKDLLEALESGHLGGAALDVLTDEPPAADNPLLRCDKVILSPHLAAFSADFSKNFWSCSAKKVIAVRDELKL